MSTKTIRVVLMTAWKKCQNGYYKDAKEILCCLLQEPFLDVSRVESTFENNMLLSETYFLLMHCEIVFQTRSTYCNSKYTTKSNIQKKFNEITQLGPLQIGIKVFQLTNGLAKFLSTPSCSQELSRLSKLIRISRFSLETRRLMTHLYSWIGMVPEMKMFGQLALDLSSQIPFAKR